MKPWHILLLVGLVAGILTGVWGKSVYDEWTAPKPLSVGDHFKAAVTDVYDADTMTLQKGKQTYKARAWGIDAPERSQRCLQNREIKTCGLMARDAFRKLVLGQNAECEVKAMDGRHDRPVVRCKLLDGKDPVKTLVGQGWAFSDKQYSDNPYEHEETQAKRGRKGLWAMEHMNPREWRARKAYQRGGTNPPQNCLKPLGPITPEA